MLNDPHVSVLMPVYNNVRFLPEAIHSILNQTYTNFELIFINDGSEEDVGAVVEDFDDTRIVYAENAENIGLTKSLNKALYMARGEIFARQDGDDISRPTRFEEQVPFFSKYDVGLVATYGIQINAFGAKLPYGDYLSKVIKVHSSKIPNTLERHNCILGPSAMFSRKVFDKIGYYDEYMVLAQDYNYWLRLTRFFGCGVVTKELYELREHADKVSHRCRKSWPYDRKLDMARNRAVSHTVIKEQ
jgi:glycosyltransferase involved in cell wall biosynthesis